MTPGKKGSKALKKEARAIARSTCGARSFLSPHQFSTALPQVAEKCSHKEWMCTLNRCGMMAWVCGIVRF